MSTETETPVAVPATPTKPCKQLEDGVNHLMQGKRHLLVKDYPSAVASLADACALIAGKYGDLAPECGEPYLCYGKALLELARAEAGVIEMAPSKSDSDEEDEDGDDKDSKEDDEDKDSKEDDEDKDSKEDDEDKDSKEDDEDKDSKEDEDDKESKESEASKSGGEESAKDGEEEEEIAKEDTAKNGKEPKNEDEAKSEKEAKTAEEGKSNGAGPPKSADDGEEVVDDQEEDGEVNNLQLAWEILEMAKIIYQKQVDGGTNSKVAKVRLSEVLLKLGEVGIESENWPTAVDDLKACLELQKEVLDPDDRRLAETFYHLAVAHSNNNAYQESIDAYEKACDQLQKRIDALEAKRPKEDMINQGLIDTEIKELEDLLVEMKERLNDTKTEKDEQASKEDQDDIVRNGSESKPVSNIAHLIRKKPKAEETETAVESKADSLDKTDGESNGEERKRKSEEDAAAGLKKAKLETES